MPAIDEVMSLVDFAIARRAPLGATWSVERLRGLRQALLRLIDQCVQREIDGCATRSDALRHLVRTIVAQGRSATVVTLNWDCLVEESVFHARESRLLRGISYGIPVHDESARRVESLPDATVILKPHGSMSWQYCAACSVVIVSIPRVSARDERRRRCPSCGKGASFERVLVAPTAFDWPQPPFLEQVWTATEQAVALADRLVFLGYSLPAQDVDVRFHLVRALARCARERTNALPVTIVAKTHADSTQNENERRRYQTLLGPRAQIDYHQFPNGLSEWTSTPSFAAIAREAVQS